MCLLYFKFFTCMVLIKGKVFLEPYLHNLEIIYSNIMSNFQATNLKKQEEILKKYVKVAFLRLVSLSEHYDLGKSDL